MASVTPTPVKKRDTTRIIMYSAIAVLLVVFIYLNSTGTQQSTTAPTHVGYRSISTAQTDPDGVLASDYTAHFARYTGGGRDPFVPLIATAGAAGRGGDRGGDWELTGISSINGVPSALVENQGTGESVFLTKGDHWRGLTVTSIESDAVQFVNALGQRTELAFPVEDDSTASSAISTSNAAAPPANLPSAGQVRPLPAVGNLPPLPVTAATQQAPAAPQAQTTPSPAGQ